jgi:hypothetical protein
VIDMAEDLATLGIEPVRTHIAIAVSLHLAST